MVLAVIMGLAGHLCASFITVFGGYAVLGLLGIDTPLNWNYRFPPHFQHASHKYCPKPSR